VARELKLPDLGEGIEEGDVVGVHVSEGDTVAKDQTVIEVETDKAVLPVPSDTAGTISKVHVKEGDTISVGTVIVTFAGEGEAEAPSKEAPKKEKQAEAPAKVEEEPAPQEKAKEKPEAAPEKPAEEKKEEAPPAEEKLRKEEKPAARVEEKPTPKEEAKPAAAPAKGEPIPAGPATRRLARELGIDLETVATAHPGERLTEDHVKEFVRRSRGGGAPTAAGPAVETPELPDFAKWGSVERKKFTSLQRKTAEHLHTGWRGMSPSLMKPT